MSATSPPLPFPHPFLYHTQDFLQTELVMHRANHDPHAYGLVDDVGADATRKLLPRAELNIAQKAANWCYVNPFKMVGEMRRERRSVPVLPCLSLACLVFLLLFSCLRSIRSPAVGAACLGRETNGSHDVSAS